VAATLGRGEVRLCRFPPPDKQRPVLVLTRDNAIRHLSTVTVAPITSTVRGVPSEVILDIEDGMKGRCAVNLHNAVTISQARLGRRISDLSSTRMEQVCAALGFALGCS
jgi:mRNA interferase MazF